MLPSGEECRHFASRISRTAESRKRGTISRLLIRDNGLESYWTFAVYEQRPNDGPKATDRHLDPSATRRVYFFARLAMDLDALLRALRLDGESRRVLIVEDDLPWQRALAEDLEARSHRVTVAIGASPAGEGKLFLPGTPPQIVATDEFDVACLDHYFPGDHDGRTLATALRKASSEVRILAMSSSAAANDAMLRSGADLAFVKSALRRVFAGR
ncbi:response regulator [bacterium]|nr:MAG: response regulator [bacterium]